ncbi:MAG TPA: serine--tRNA ligase [Alphaproteobacteria bacterium]|nr:serine--tRNA ligase [Alphaproteobacteria bacterium]HAJ45329.1 serine--tRNA ligase [Alphaproteobacteria bacterium]
MHDIKFIRDDPAAFDAGLATRGLEPQAQGILALDQEIRALQTRLQEMQARRNEASKLIGQAKARKDEAAAGQLMQEVADLKTSVQESEERERVLQDRLHVMLSAIPNIPTTDAPVGEDEGANVEVRKVGEPRRLNAAKQHFELGEALGQMDFETAAKMSGARFVILRRQLARLERALANFMLDLHTQEHGYQETCPPFLVRDEAMYGTGQLPKFQYEQFTATQIGNRADLLTEALKGIDEFHAGRGTSIAESIAAKLDHAPTKEAYWLIPTSEVPLTNQVRDTILDESALPLRYTAWTPCFRAEAGAAGRDTRGMIRMHQFQKVELVSITTPEQSLAEHERMTACAEEVLKRLGLAYRVMALSTGDMGFSARKTYDLEVWLPGQNAYREISSCSNCGDFQARRLMARYRPGEGKGTRFVHTLNGSGVAVGRALVAVLETYQNEDGTVTIPEALRPYMGGQTVIAAHGA